MVSEKHFHLIDVKLALGFLNVLAFLIILKLIQRPSINNPGNILLKSCSKAHLWKVINAITSQKNKVLKWIVFRRKSHRVLSLDWVAPTCHPTLPCGQSNDDVRRQALTSNYTSDDNNLKLMFNAGELSGHFKVRQEARRRESPQYEKGSMGIAGAAALYAHYTNSHEEAIAKSTFGINSKWVFIQ